MELGADPTVDVKSVLLVGAARARVYVRTQRWDRGAMPWQVCDASR